MVCVMAIMTSFVAVYTFISVSTSYHTATNGQNVINTLIYFKHEKARVKLGK